MKKVLVVDDTKNIRMLLTKCLQLEGFEVFTANDGFQALDLFAREKFDFAFLDIKMPNMSGTELLKKLREMGICIPVIIITAYATVKNAIECTHLGAVAYLQKPFTSDKVRATLKELIEVNCSLDFDEENILQQAEKYISDGLFEAAIDLLKKYMHQMPLNKDIYSLLSRAYFGLGKGNEGEKFKNIYTALK